MGSMPDRFGKNQKPLFVIRSPVRAKGYRSNFKPFETTRFLDSSKLAKLRRHSLEVGTLEAAGQDATVVAEIRNGAVIGLTLRRCAGCPRMRKRVDKRTLLAVRERRCGDPHAATRPVSKKPAEIWLQNVNENGGFVPLTNTPTDD
jgi:hypothetical protein